MGKSQGGSTTKIHMATDAHGNPLYFEITGGEVHDSKAAKKVISQIEGETLDKGYDSDKIREQARSKNMIPIIGQKA